MKIIRKIFNFCTSKECRLHTYMSMSSNSSRMYKYARKKLNKKGNEIELSATIGNNLFLPHPIGIIIGGECIVGNNVWIYQNVTIGQSNGKYPTIEDNVVIFPNSVIFGDVTIGENSIIGAGSIVSESCPPNSVLAGNPAKVVGTRKNKQYV